MAKKGRPINLLRAQLDHNYIYLNESQSLIVATLERSAMTFSGLQKTTKLSPNTLDIHLEKLDRKGYVRRSPGDPRIYELTPLALNPVRKTLRKLATISLTVQLDVQKGKQLLAPETVGPVLKFATLLWGPKEHKSDLAEYLEQKSVWITYGEQQNWMKQMMVDASGGEEKIPPSLREIVETPPKLNELLLLKGLARYDVETRFFPKFAEDSREIAWSGMLVRRIGYSIPALADPTSFKAFYKTESGNPEMFPITAMVRKLGKDITANLNELLEWIRPLIEGPIDVRRMVKEQPNAKVPPDVLKRIFSKPDGTADLSLIPREDNLAADVYLQGQLNYIDLLCQVWREKLFPSSSKGAGKGKGRRGGEI
ncbi:MAG: hypothetical protein AB1305_05005 [Candidatus Hadarchaeota archaeon]